MGPQPGTEPPGSLPKAWSHQWDEERSAHREGDQETGVAGEVLDLPRVADGGQLVVHRGGENCLYIVQVQDLRAQSVLGKAPDAVGPPPVEPLLGMDDFIGSLRLTQSSKPTRAHPAPVWSLAPNTHLGLPCLDPLVVYQVPSERMRV